MLHYSLAFVLEKLGKKAEAAAHYAAAAQAPPDYVFPFRREHFEVLQRARAYNARDPRAPLYLGNLFMLHGQVDAAIAQWEDARNLDPRLALVHRNLALAYARRPEGRQQAIASMEKALKLDPAQPRWCVEFDQLSEDAGLSIEKRLAQFEQYQAAVVQRDDALAREIALRVDAGQLERALAMLRDRQFHIWEGAGRTAVHNSYAGAHLALGQRALEGGQLEKALEHFGAALQYPANLGTGRPVRGERLSETYYHLGLAYQAMGRPQDAADSFAKAVATAPADLAARGSGVADDPEPRYFAARALERLDRGDEARRLFEGLIESGRMRLADHVPMPFFASFGHPQSEAARHAQAHYTIALGWLGLGKKDEARKAFETALGLNAGHSAAKKQVSLLK